MKKFFSLLTAALFAGSMFAAEIVFSGADFTGGTANTGSAFSVTKSGVTVAANKAYGTGSELRVYATGEDDTQPSTLVVSAGTVKITKIAAEFGQYSKATFEDATPNASTWSIEPEKQLRITKLTVTIDGDAGDDEGGAIIDDGSQGGDEGDYCTVTATGKWAFTASYYDFYEDGSVDVNLFTDDSWYFDEEGYLYGSGAGAVLVLSLIPNDQTNLVGTYSVADNTIDPGYCFTVEYASDDDTEGTSYEIASGTVTIALNTEGTAYTLTYDLVDAADTKLSGVVNGLCLPEISASLENIELTEKAQKVVVDGVVYIIRDNKLYNLQGTQVR